jgi:hypothetical protein
MVGDPTAAPVVVVPVGPDPAPSSEVVLVHLVPEHSHDHTSPVPSQKLTSHSQI